ncbi:MAG TPA: hypothetical protein VI215_08470 [Bacteroidota bacterium]
MRTPASLLPDSQTLLDRLSGTLSTGGGKRGDVALLDRTPPRMMSTFPNEVVTCRSADGKTRKLFIKYAGGREHDAFGHRGGIAYEAEVYARILNSYPDFRPKCIGTQAGSGTRDAWLLLEFIDRSVRLSDVSVRQRVRQPAAMSKAVNWIGTFHSTHETDARKPDLSFLASYDARYYGGWALRTAEYAESLLSRFPWLSRLWESGDEWFKPLLAAPRTVIHGEFYAKTVLLRRDQIYIIDWESAAYAPGEIDLAALTEGIRWPASIVRLCEREYLRARWPEGPPSQFERILDAARMYLHFRWLGERPDWTLREKSFWRFDQLFQTARRMGLL